MATATHSLDLTRPHWGGDLSNIDQHLEIYTGTIDSEFEYNAIFRALSTQKTTADRSNAIRIDRLGTSQLKARKSGETVEAQRVKSDKLMITVEVMLYIRNLVDYIDDWTAPDYWVEMGRNNSTEFALEYDQAHIIRLQKAPEWKAPAHLKPAFKDGFHVDAVLTKGLSTAALEADAETIVRAHGALVNEMIKRRIPMGDVRTIVDPDIYAALLHHPKLINKDYVADNGDFAGRRVVRVNGVEVVESTAFPTGAVTDHNLSTEANSNAFDLTETEATGRMIVFSLGKSLVTLTARDFESDLWDDKDKKCFVLDNQAMFTVDLRRPDTVGVVRFAQAGE